MANVTANPPADPTKANPEALPRASMTLALTQAQTEKMKLAVTLGELSLGLRNDNSEVNPGRASTSTTCSTDRSEDPAMTVVVDHDTEAAQTLAAAIGGDCALLSGLDQVRRHLEENPRETVVVLGVTVDAQAAFHFARAVRVQNTALGVIMVRRRVGHERARRGAPLRRARGRHRPRAVRALRCCSAGQRGRPPDPSAGRRLGRRRGGRSARPRDHGLLGEGRLRQDDDRDQPRRCAGRPRAPRGLPGRPRPRLRRRRHRAAALPGPHDRRRRAARRHLDESGARRHC